MTFDTAVRDAAPQAATVHGSFGSAVAAAIPPITAGIIQDGPSAKAHAADLDPRAHLAAS
jgi:hypothetical protein